MTSKIIHGLSVDDVTRTGVRCLTKTSWKALVAAAPGNAETAPAIPIHRRQPAPRLARPFVHSGLCRAAAVVSQVSAGHSFLKRTRLKRTRLKRARHRTAWWPEQVRP